MRGRQIGAARDPTVIESHENVVIDLVMALN